MGRSQRRQHEAIVDHVHDTFRVRSPVYRYLVVGQKVDNKGVMMLRCTFCNKVFQGTQFQATRHFSQTNYCRDVSDEALYEIARQTQQKFEADQMKRVSRYAAERELDVPGTGGARGGEAGRRPAEGGVGGDGRHGAADPTLGGGGGETEEGVIHVDREARGPGDEGVPEREDVPDFYPCTGERLEDWRRRAGKGAATEGSSKRKEGGSDPAATPAGKRLWQQKVTDVYGGEWVARHKKAFLRWLYSRGFSFNAFRNQVWKAYQQVLLEQPGSSPQALLPNHYEIASMRAVETHRAELAEELEEVRQPFWVGRYDAWLVGQAKRYILTQTRFELKGAEYILACPQFGDFHIQQAERNWAVHEGIHTKKRNQLTFEKVVQLIEITANVWLTEYRRAGCGYVLPWQRDEGMLDCQEGLELEPVRTGTRRGMTDEEIARQVALITRDPIGASAPPSADAVFDRRACIFRRYPRDEDSDEEPIPEAADDPALRIPWEIDETHEDPSSEDTRGGGPGGERDAGGRRGLLGPIREELGSSLPQRGLLQRGGAVRQLRLRSPSPGIGQEEGGSSAAAVESSMAPSAVSDATIAAAVEEIAAASVLEEMAASVLAEDPPAAGGGATVEGQVAAAGGAGGGAAEVEVEVAAALEEEDAPCGGATSTDRAPSRDEAPGRTSTQTAKERTTTQSPDAAHDIMERERARLLASTDPRAQAFARAVEDARRLDIGGDCVQGGVVAGEDVAEGVAAEPVPEAMPGGAETADIAVEGRTQAVDEAVQAGQRRVEGAIDSRREGQETTTGPVVPFSGLHLAQARQPQAVQMAVHGVPPPIITDLGSEPVVVPPRLPSHFAPQEVRRPLDAEELAREAVRDVTRLDRRIFDRKLEHPPWQSIPSVPWGPASPLWSGSTSTGGHTAGHVPGVSGGVTETARRTGDMPPPPPRAPAGDPSSSPTGRGSRFPHTPGRSRIRDTTAVQQDVCDTTIFGRTDIHLDSTRRVTEHTARLQPGLGGGGARTTMAREVPASDVSLSEVVAEECRPIPWSTL
ncbi:hypothetical protein CBR_g55950 [Chara braunii]|uniref:DUF659 domain-containing protein n=1 Tax=Chara braunii TaxID=69332 RepID=A0A388MDB3_CHABU|nr:hypothetical protein CBR_g55950 [Chara braunii]|eukprot:GBG92556.1 hypothetical protein CBR_g55950 [Chara braunii]